MGIEAVRKILSEQLDTVWNDRTFIAWDNIDYYPKPGDTFLRCSLSGVYARSIGIKCQRESFLFAIQVLTPSIEGEYLNMGYCDILAAGFVGFAEGNVVIESVTSERIGPDKEWYVRNTLIDLYNDSKY